MPADRDQLILNMQEIIKKVPSKYYADFLFDNNSVYSITKSISDETVSILPKTFGFVFRIFDGSQWWEIADPDLNLLSNRITQLMQSIQYSPKIHLHQYPKHELNKSANMKKDFTKVTLDEKLTKIRNIYSQMQKADKRVINPRVSYVDRLSEQIFLNTEGSLLRETIPRIRLMILPIVREGSTVEYDYHIVTREAGFEITDEFTDDVIQATVNQACALLGAKAAPSGTMPIVLDPAMTGLIAHESMGHGLEADQIVRDRSYLKAHLNQRVASSIVNISDSPIEPGLIGTHQFDHEGILAKKTFLIENGVFTNCLHTRLTASLMNAEPCGNGRRESFMHPVYPRMTNTFFEPGDYGRDEIIREMKSGVVLIKGNFGMEDPLGGGVQCTSKYGYLIENGEKVQLLKGVTLSGQVLDVLQDIDAVSKGPMEFDGGTCGKGIEDKVPVSSGGVWVRAKRGIVSPG